MQKVPPLNNTDIFSEELVLTSLHAGSSTEAITILGKLLNTAGYVKDTFIESVIEREKEFATGLPLGRVNVALPHTDSIHVNRQGIAVGVFKEPVEFHVMGDPEKLVPVSIVFLLAIKEDSDQVRVLQGVVDIIQRPAFIDGLLCARTPVEIARLLQSEPA